MLTLNILLASVLMVGIIWTFYQLHQIRKHKKINQIISREIESLYDAVQVEIKKNLNLIKRAKGLVKDAKGSGRGEDPLASPEMLASVITVIVAKYGNLRLGMDDFAEATETDYVSVYFDISTNDLILSLDHDLESTGDPSVVSFQGMSDDETYH